MVSGDVRTNLKLCEKNTKAITEINEPGPSVSEEELQSFLTLLEEKALADAVDMETAMLYATAKRAGKKALAIFTVSDRPLTGEGLSADERERTFDEMIKLALDLAAAI